LKLISYLEEAKYCIEIMKKIGTYRKLQKGRVIIYRKDGNSFVIELAYSKEQIKKNLSLNNLNVTYSTCVGVPKTFIISIVNKLKFIAST